MPLRVLYENNWCTIRPTPLVSISSSILKTSAGISFGVTYTITLTGTLLADQGTPYGFSFDENRYDFVNDDAFTPNFVGPYGAFDNNRSHFNNNRPPKQIVPQSQLSSSIFSKQRALRALFAIDGKLMSISDFEDDGATIFCMPRLVDISFQEGTYVDRCDYTITLECDSLFRNNLKIDYEGTLIPKFTAGLINIEDNNLINDQLGSYLQDFNEEWTIDTEEQPENNQLTRTYKVTHTISATGKTHYYLQNNTSQVLSAYESAKRFVLDKLRNYPQPLNGGYPNLNDTPWTGLPPSPPSPVGNFPNIFGVIGEGTLDLINQYGGFNHIRNEQSNVSAGTFSVTETWILSQSPVFETFNISIESTTDTPFVSVSIDGNIRGLSDITAKGYGGVNTPGYVTPFNNGENNLKLTGYENALLKYNQITNNGQFGITSDVYKRASNVTTVPLNVQPLSASVASSPSTSEITYNVRFDNRPTNVITGALTESISVNDTYPGDVFAVIPVIGRKTGPILQYIGGRTEYKRDLQISLLMDYTKVAYGPYRSSYMLQKPSIIEPTASELMALISQFSPANEPGVRKYFVSPPSETWNPKEGSYSLSLTWTYELDK